MKEGTVLIEARERLSRSRLWKWQRRYFTNQGTAAWQRGVVPHYVTSNAFIAEAYAKVVLGYLRDCRPTSDPAQPIYIVELGAGVGRFGYHFLKRFFDQLQRSPLAGLHVRYVLTRPSVCQSPHGSSEIELDRQAIRNLSAPHPHARFSDEKSPACHQRA